MRASVVCDSRFTQIRAKVCSPSDIRRCIPIPDAKATSFVARLFRSAFGAKRLCGDIDRSTLPDKSLLCVKGGGNEHSELTEGLFVTQISGGSKPHPYTTTQDCHPRPSPTATPRGASRR